jgi:hypothetical protein
MNLHKENFIMNYNLFILFAAVLWIRIWSDPKLLAGFGSGYGSGKIIPEKIIPEKIIPEKIITDPGSSGSEISLKYNYSEKLAKFDHF